MRPKTHGGGVQRSEAELEPSLTDSETAVDPENTGGTFEVESAQDATENGLYEVISPVQGRETNTQDEYDDVAVERISETMKLARTVAQSEYAHSFFLASTLQSTTVPVVSATLPLTPSKSNVADVVDDAYEALEGDSDDIFIGDVDRRTESDEDLDEIALSDSSTALGIDSMVIGSFTYEGLTFAMVGEKELALIAIEPELLSDQVKETGSLALPGKVIFDDEDTYSLTSISSAVISHNDESIMETLIIPASVNDVADDALKGATALQNIEVVHSNPIFSSYDGCLYAADTTCLLLVPEGRLGAVRVAPSTEEVGSAALSHCAGVVALSVDADSVALSALEDDELYNANGDRIEVVIVEEAVDIATEKEALGVEEPVLMLSSSSFLIAATTNLTSTAAESEGVYQEGAAASSESTSIETAQSYAAKNGGLVSKGDIELYFGNLDNNFTNLSAPGAPNAYLNRTSANTPNYGAAVTLTYDKGIGDSSEYVLEVANGNRTNATAIWDAMAARAQIAAPAGTSIVGINLRGVGSKPDASTYVTKSQFISGNFTIVFSSAAIGGSYQPSIGADGSVKFRLLFGVVYGASQTITPNDRVELYVGLYSKDATTGYTNVPPNGSPDAILNAIEDEAVSNYGAESMVITWRAYSQEQNIATANQYDIQVNRADWDKTEAAWNKLSRRFSTSEKTLAGLCARKSVKNTDGTTLHQQQKDTYVGKNTFLNGVFDFSIDAPAMGGNYNNTIAPNGTLTFKLLMSAVYEETRPVSAGNVRAYFGNLTPENDEATTDSFIGLPAKSSPDAYLNATSEGTPNYGAVVKISWVAINNTPNPFSGAQSEKNISYRLEVSGGDPEQAKTIWDRVESRLRRSGQTLCGWVLRNNANTADTRSFISKEDFLSGTFSTSFEPGAWGGSFPGSLSEDGTIELYMLFGAVYGKTQSPVKGNIELYLGSINDKDDTITSAGKGGAFSNVPAPGNPSCYLNATSSNTPNYGGDTSLTWKTIDRVKNPFNVNVGRSVSDARYSLRVTNGDKAQAAAIWSEMEKRLARPGKSIVGFVTREYDPAYAYRIDRGSFVSKEDFLSGSFEVGFSGSAFGGSFPGSLAEDGTILCRLIFGAVYGEALSDDNGTLEMYFGRIDEVGNYPMLTKPGNPTAYFNTADMGAPNLNAETSLTYVAYDGVKNPFVVNSNPSPYILTVENGDPEVAKAIWNNVEAVLVGEGQHMVGITARGKDGFPDMSTYVSKEQFLSGSYTMTFHSYALGGAYPGYLNEDGSYLFRMLYNCVIEDMPAVKYTFHANDGAWSDGDTEKTFTSYEDAMLQVPDASLGLKRSGYVFDKWTDASGVALPDKVPAADADYYAKWIGIKYTLQFDADGDGAADTGLGTLTVALDDDPAKDLAAPAALAGFVFEGWSFTNKANKTIDYGTGSTAAHVLADLVEQSPSASDVCLLAARWRPAVRVTVPLQVNVGLGVGETLASQASLITNSAVDLDIVGLTVDAPDVSGSSLSFAAESDAAKVFPDGIKGMALVLSKVDSGVMSVEIEVGSSIADTKRVGGLFIPAAQSGKDGKLDLSYDINLNGVTYDFPSLYELAKDDNFELPIMKLSYTVAPTVDVWERADTAIVSELM